MPYLKEGEEGEKEGWRDRALPTSQRQLPQRYHLQAWNDPTRDWSAQFVDSVLLDKNCWFLAFEGPELLILLK